MRVRFPSPAHKLLAHRGLSSFCSASCCPLPPTGLQWRLLRCFPAGTFSIEERALAVALEAERHAAEVAGGAAGGLDPATRATRTIAEYAPLFLRHHPPPVRTRRLTCGNTPAAPLASMSAVGTVGLAVGACGPVVYCPLRPARPPCWRGGDLTAVEFGGVRHLELLPPRVHVGLRSPEDLLRSGLKACLRSDAVGDRPVVAGDDGRGVVDLVDEHGEGAGDAGLAGGFEGNGDRGGGEGDGSGEAADDGFAGDGAVFGVVAQVGVELPGQ